MKYVQWWKRRIDLERQDSKSYIQDFRFACIVARSTIIHKTTRPDNIWNLNLWDLELSVDRWTGFFKEMKRSRYHVFQEETVENNFSRASHIVIITRVSEVNCKKCSRRKLVHHHSRDFDNIICQCRSDQRIGKVEMTANSDTWRRLNQRSKKVNVRKKIEKYFMSRISWFCIIWITSRMT